MRAQYHARIHHPEREHCNCLCVNKYYLNITYRCTMFCLSQRIIMGMNLHFAVDTFYTNYVYESVIRACTTTRRARRVLDGRI